MELNKAELDTAVAEVQAVVLQMDQLIASIPAGILTPPQVEPLKNQIVAMQNALKSTNDRLVALGTEPEPPAEKEAEAENVDTEEEEV